MTQRCGDDLIAVNDLPRVTVPLAYSMFRFCRKHGSRSQGVLATGLLVTALLVAAIPCCAQQNITLQTAPGGLPIGGTSPSFTSGFGNVNGLGVGTPTAGATVLTAGVSGGVLYTTPYNLVISGMGATDLGTVSAFVSSPFANPSILILKSCYPAAGCGGAGGFTTISLSSVSQTDVIPAPGVSNGTYTAYLGLFVSNTNGAGAFTGTDVAEITWTLTDTNTGVTSEAVLTLNTPSENVQTAVQLLLATAAGGLTISPAADFSTDFGNVNGLGVGTPSPGLTTLGVAGGVIYKTPYLIQPSFSSFTSTTCSVRVYVSTDFANPNTLQLRDATATGGPYTNISKVAGAPTTITTTTASGSTITRYLGLFVSSANGAGAFPGTAGAAGGDSATLTYTLTVP